MKPLLTLDSLSFSYSVEKKLINQLNWTLSTGEICCLAGRNGTGKTTLARLLIGQIQPQRGSLKLKETELKGEGIPFRAGRIGLALQNPDLQLFAPTVMEELNFGPRNMGWDKIRREQRVDEALELFKLTELKNENPMVQTFGIRKKIALASVYAMDPEVYLLDEPDWSLDREEWDSLKGWIRSEAKRGKGIMIISHNLEPMTELCDSMLVLTGDGCWVSGSPEQLLFQDDAPLGKTDLAALAEKGGFQALSPGSWAEKYNPSGQVFIKQKDKL